MARKTLSSEKLKYEKDMQALREEHQLELRQQQSHAPARKRRKTTMAAQYVYHPYRLLFYLLYNVELSLR